MSMGTDFAEEQFNHEQFQKVAIKQLNSHIAEVFKRLDSLESRLIASEQLEKAEKNSDDMIRNHFIIQVGCIWNGDSPEFFGYWYDPDDAQKWADKYIDQDNEYNIIQIIGASNG